MTAEPVLKIVEHVRNAAAMLHPLRLRLLENLARPDSASGLARRLNLPRQKVNYHLRELEKVNLVEFVEERRKGNCTERFVKGVAHAYLISPAVLGRLAAEPGDIRDRFSASYLVAVAAAAIRDLGTLIDRARRARKRLATFTLLTDIRFANAADQNAFTQELAGEIARLTAKYHRENALHGRLFRFFTGAYPAIRKREDEPGNVKEELK